MYLGLTISLKEFEKIKKYDVYVICAESAYAFNSYKAMNDI
ncbi:hypothetical protein Lepto7375DRAFT_2235 [Leptolyngbya sp. PCC 7375]|nr:hypothetical protein Lepto7375DRAFT_2235 [Leptolyngbya sp. PCC 7375]